MAGDDRHPTCRLRPMEEADLEAVLAIERDCYPSPWSPAAFLGELQGRNTSCSVVAVEEPPEGGPRVVVGYICAWIVRDVMQVNNIAVRPDRRGRGVGKRLMQVVLEEGRRRGTAACFLDVRPSNEPALNLYEKLGFERVGLRPGYYRDTQEDALVMRLDME